MQILLKNIVEFSSGIYVNTASSKGEEVYYLQVRNLNKAKAWVDGLVPELFATDRLKRNYLFEGDILLATKGTDHVAALYDGKYSPAVGSSVFTILRIIEKGTLLPEYLQWYLNHSHANKQLTSIAKGTSIPHITMDTLAEITISIPPVKEQELIVQAHKLQHRRSKLQSEINRLNDFIFQQQLLEKATHNDK